MRAVVQRVSSSNVKVNGEVIGSIGRGLNVLIGISNDDTIEDLKYIKDKIVNLRIFEDENDKMNFSVLDVKGELLIISQFTLYGDCRKGRRPNFMNAKGGEEAKVLYLKLIEMLQETGLNVQTGEFGADMKVDIQNDGPVTLLLDSTKEF
ncbi:D-tyrosyl-tRNA(Tyr) deacylase [Clostridium baratii]|uniref:D-aminoacyl-tRNA deacylase n=1 Tax=Clostridium baratii TaxID=1561 RepID=UPI0005F29591|nr:D-aminoacyl-tRNA deacylase [Clostridium baratii]KJU70872.1 tyrosyl-tRNA deacylase [Clostridium baratii]OPF51911.1 D-tyrosyl-tRNA(Tyr) deacylase [Clostridium baratii]OPF53556.1 D-tyrosyl-tRNA(Tyr) deacylase [Clostridium baratii]OPF56511.1 D-tyrosyl-tRNA(Tyr) deacylase [Clostridium baratii]OPF60603.1 D-tyrosyl-tRNA(Tyr) deacylase [Clostridium baratii]